MANFKKEIMVDVKATMDDVRDKYPNISSSIFKSEGDELCHRGEHKKAIEAYTKAIALENELKKESLSSRARCLLHIGESDKALKDAENALDLDEQFYDAIYLKAEALYNLHQFEEALMFYHRGRNLRPDKEGFKMGICKAEEAINLSIGPGVKISLEKEGDLSYFDNFKPSVVGRRHGTYGWVNPRHQDEDEDGGKRVVKNSIKAQKRLLGKLYTDKQFLEEMSKMTDDTTEGRELQSLLKEGVAFLEGKEEFWRAQHPLYSRAPSKPFESNSDESGDRTNDEQVTREIDKIEELQRRGDHDCALRRLKALLTDLEYFPSSFFPSKERRRRESLKAKVHYTMGVSYLGQQDNLTAMDHLNKACDAAKEAHNRNVECKILSNIGKCFARQGEYAKAIDIWKKTLESQPTNACLVWLYHEIGACYLEVRDLDMALEYAEQALDCAVCEEDTQWQMYSTMIIGKAQFLQENLSSALISFQKALALAEARDDKITVRQIRRAIRITNDIMVERIKQLEEDEIQTSMSEMAEAIANLAYDPTTLHQATILPDDTNVMDTIIALESEGLQGFPKIIPTRRAEEVKSITSENLSTKQKSEEIT